LALAGLFAVYLSFFLPHYSWPPDVLVVASFSCLGFMMLLLRSSSCLFVAAHFDLFAVGHAAIALGSSDLGAA
jgi:hypothetical protein